MLGPYPISETTSLPAGKIGAYILSKDGKTAHYVGRSDADLASRLMSYRSSDYTTFWYEFSASVVLAYYLECEWYHKYHPADNQNHPAVPPGASWKCPVAGCSWG